jgi:hypothetical protein
MNKPNQRRGSESNARVGREFEIATQEYFASKKQLNLNRSIQVKIGIESIKKLHSFDLGSLDQKILIECKSHKWTAGDNVPSAKLTVWNEAMYYFFTAPKVFRKIMFVLRDYSSKRKKTLAEYYIEKNKHLIPNDVEFWEYDEDKNDAIILMKDNVW